MKQKTRVVSAGPTANACSAFVASIRACLAAASFSSAPCIGWGGPSAANDGWGRLLDWRCSSMIDVFRDISAASCEITDGGWVDIASCWARESQSWRCVSSFQMCSQLVACSRLLSPAYNGKLSCQPRLSNPDLRLVSPACFKFHVTKASPRHRITQSERKVNSSNISRIGTMNQRSVSPWKMA